MNSPNSNVGEPTWSLRWIDCRHVILTSDQKVAATHLSLFSRPPIMGKIFFSGASEFPSQFNQHLFHLDHMLYSTDTKVTKTRSLSQRSSYQGWGSQTYKQISASLLAV